LPERAELFAPRCRWLDDLHGPHGSSLTTRASPRRSGLLWPVMVHGSVQVGRAWPTAAR
jgi:hypothetical protein